MIRALWHGCRRRRAPLVRECRDRAGFRPVDDGGSVTGSAAMAPYAVPGQVPGTGRRRTAPRSPTRDVGGLEGRIPLDPAVRVSLHDPFNPRRYGLSRVGTRVLGTRHRTVGYSGNGGSCVMGTAYGLRCAQPNDAPGRQGKAAGQGGRARGSSAWPRRKSAGPIAGRRPPGTVVRRRPTRHQGMAGPNRRFGQARVTSSR